MAAVWRDGRRCTMHDRGRRDSRCRAAWWMLLHGLAGVVVLPGCAWVRAQAQQRSAECEQLCSQAELATESGRVDRADEYLDAALKKSPRDLATQRQLSDSLWHVGRHRESLTLLGQLAEAHPHDIRLAMTLAERHAELGHRREALNWAHSALAMDQDSGPALELVARLETANGQDDQALASYLRLSHHEDRQPAALIEMGTIHLQRGQPERAAPLLRSALTLPQSTLAERHAAEWKLGVAYARMERWSDASTHLAAAAPHRDMTADDWHGVAYAQFRTGQIGESRTTLNHALAQEPQHPASQRLSAILMRESGRSTPAGEPLIPVGFERAQAPPSSTWP